MKILVTGAGGFVAGSVIAQSATTFEVHTLARRTPEGLPSNVRFHPADITDHAGITTLLNDIRPDAVIHTAAMANIDLCQTQPDQARRVNTVATQHLAEQCERFGSRLIFCSTDTVFDGMKGNYHEQDEPRAVNVYAETKIAAEQAVLAASAKHLVVRLSLVMGLPVIGSGNSFIADLIRKTDLGQPMNFPLNEVRTPIDVITLGAALLELTTPEISGILHLAGNTRTDRFTMARQIAAQLGISEEKHALIHGTDSNAIEGRARRPNDASLDNGKARRLLKTPMPDLLSGLRLVMNNPWNKML